jgi:hypothetical protein
LWSFLHGSGKHVFSADRIDSIFAVQLKGNFVWVCL